MEINNRDEKLGRVPASDASKSNFPESDIMDHWLS